MESLLFPMIHVFFIMFMLPSGKWQWPKIVILVYMYYMYWRKTLLKVILTFYLTVITSAPQIENVNLIPLLLFYTGFDSLQKISLWNKRRQHFIVPTKNCFCSFHIKYDINWVKIRKIYNSNNDQCAMPTKMTERFQILSCF